MSWVRRGLLVVTAMVVSLSGAATALADPPNMMPVPASVPEGIDAAVPAPPVPRLARIPARSVTPGAPRSLEELREAMMPSPSGDPFFDRWPADLAAHRPGNILFRRDVTPVAGPLMMTPIRYARQIKFRTVDASGRPLFGTATVFVPRAPWRGKGARPVVVNNVPIVALGTKCTPGYTLSHGYDSNANSTDIFPPLAQLALQKGYAVIVPDHTGARMAYAEPFVAAHVILDAIRAASADDPANFAHGPIAMLGYSGGAIATNATARLVPQYAPELQDRFVGAAIGGVPADYRALVGAMNANLASGVFLSAVMGISREHPDMLPMANNLARWLATSPLKDICTGTMGYLGLTMLPAQLLSNNPDPFHSPVAERLYELTSMPGTKSPMPLFIYHGAQEWWIPASQAQALFRDQCRLGANVTFREYPGEHMLVVFTGFPDAAAWLDQRLQGIPAPNGCPR
ncbi:lipase family protein [Gordonia sp. NPDC003424]